MYLLFWLFVSALTEDRKRGWYCGRAAPYWRKLQLRPPSPPPPATLRPATFHSTPVPFTPWPAVTRAFYTGRGIFLINLTLVWFRMVAMMLTVLLCFFILFYSHIPTLCLSDFQVAVRARSRLCPCLPTTTASCLTSCKHLCPPFSCMCFLGTLKKT